MYIMQIKYFPKLEQILNRTRKIVIDEIDIRFDIVEFTDGLYFLTYNKFVPLKTISNKKTSKIGTTKYYSKTYKHLKIPNT
jgi:hypothetical protein